MRYNKEWFNPLFFILNHLLKDNSIRTILVYGGKSSSKTVSIVQLLSKEAKVKGASTIAFRKESTTILTTLKESFNLAIKSMWLSNVFTTLEFSYRCDNAKIVLKGLDNEEKAKGIESFKYLYLDELNHFTEDEFSQFNMSLRGMPGQKIFASWNPVDENSWVKTELVDKYEFKDMEFNLPCEDSFVRKSKCGKVVLIKTTYQDNYWINGSPSGTYGFRDENLINEYEGLRTRNFNRYRVNVLGEWGKVVFGGEFLKCWRSEDHTGEYFYNPELAIYLSFDENVNPYFPVGIFQVSKNEKEIFLIDCIAAKNPNNTTKWICAEITRKLHQWGHKGNVYVCGDATSQKDDVKQEKGHDLFRLIINELIEFKPIRRVSKSNPSVKASAEFFNSILEVEAEGLRFRVDKRCRVAILDYENTKEDKNGGVDKKTVTDPVTKVSYQPWGHFVDLTRYLLTTVFASEYAKYQNGGVAPTYSLGLKDFDTAKRY